jgi:hypothetical protein
VVERRADAESVTGPPPRPPALVLGALVVTLEALAVLGWAGWLGWELATRTPGSRAVAEGSTAYFAVFGVLVLLVAVALWRGHGWAAGAGTFLQLLCLPLAWYMVQERFWLGAVPAVVLAVTGLYALNTAVAREALGR